MLKSVHEPIRVREKIAHCAIRHGCGRGHGTDLWMLVYLLPLFRFSRTRTRTRITDTDHNSRTYGWLASVVTLPGAYWYTLLVFVTCRTYIIITHDLLMNDLNPQPFI